jgi:2-methylisocitrate lyase-like PEP mutase family enzyme
VSTPENLQLNRRCDLLKALHRPGEPLLLPTVWDVATARAVVGEGYPVVATTSWGVAGTLGYADDEAAPADEMLAAAARICRGVDVPVTVDTEAGYGLEPTTLVAALLAMGAAGCNLEDTNHRDASLRDHAGHADWLRSIRQAASAQDYRLVVNARVDTFLVPYIEGAQPGSQLELVPDAIERANAYLAAGADCVYPIALWQPEAVERFMAEVEGPVNLSYLPESPPLAELSSTGVARVSWAIFLYEEAMAQFHARLTMLRS